MPRKPRFTLALDSASARLALKPRKKFYTIRVSPGIRLAFRRNAGPGTWTVVTPTWSKKFATADDFEAANGSTVLSFHEAVDTARKLARGDDIGEVEEGRPKTVAEAVDAYERELKATGRRVGNATRVTHHLNDLPALRDKPVTLLTAANVRTFRDLLVEKKLRPATIRRTLKALCRALSFAADNDDRITNISAWKKLAAVRDSTVARGALWILNDAQMDRAVKAAYVTGGHRFGLYAEVLATFGVRPIQARRLTVGDLEGDVLQMPSSMKGKERLRIDREPLPLPHGLALRLAAEAAGRGPDEPLLRDDDGNARTEGGHPDRWEAAAAAAKLPLKQKREKRRNRHPHVGIYALRHSSIARNLLRGLPISVVARAHDTSEQEIRTHYGRYIAHTAAAQDMMRAALPTFDQAAPAANVVVPLKVAKRKGRA